ncbi:MAG: hypothetical protein ACI8Z1_001801 [Candidatus Azotimanducaceae bacterium]|jgi:hypothetical protein
MKIWGRRDPPGLPAPALHAELLEPRVLLSAEMGLGLDSSQLNIPFDTITSDEQMLEDLSAQLVNNNAINPLVSELPGAMDLNAVAPFLDEKTDFDIVDYLSAQEDSSTREIIFVDTSIADYEQFVLDIKSSGNQDVNYDIVLIDDSENGLMVIEEYLQGKPNISGIHLVSHGEDSTLKLGNVWLSQDNLALHEATIANWGLRTGADILIYGCNLGRDPDGISFIQDLAELTGADIAASDDLTGASEFNADWELELSTGNIETQVPFSEALMQNWVHVLAPPSTTGIADVEVNQGASNTVIDLLTVFSDVEDLDTLLVFSVEANSNPTLFDNVTVSNLFDRLTLSYDPDTFGSSDLTIKATDTNGETVTTTFTVSVNLNAALLLSTTGDAIVTGSGLTNWNDSEIVQLGGPTFTLGNTTAGVFSSLVNIAGDVDGLHHVTSNLTIGTSNTIAVQPGDLLISLGANSTLTSTGAAPEADLSVTPEDIFLVRPEVVGDYSAVNFFMVLDNVPGGVEGISLVEEDTIVGDALLTAGDILIAPGNRDINLYKPDDLAVASSGTALILIAGDDLRDSSGTKMVNRFIAGVDLIENSLDVGGLNLSSGTVLLTVGSNSATVFGKDGANPDTTLSVTEFDIFAADISKTSLGTDALVGTATIVLEGIDIDLSDGPIKEDIDALSIFTSVPEGVPNIAPVGVGDAYVVEQGASLTLTDTTTFVISNDTDTDGDTLNAALVSLPSSSSAFAFNNDGSFSYTHDGIGVLTDSFTYAVGDSKGGVSVATVTLTINPMANSPPTASDKTVTTAESTAYTVNASDFNFADGDGDTLNSIKVTGLESSGNLKLNGVDVTLNQVVSKADIDSNLLVFTPITGENGTGYDNFKFLVNDGTVDAATSSTLTVDVTVVNDTPTATNLTSVTAYTEGNAGAAIADIVVTDNDAAPAQTITATLTLSDVATGTLTTTGAATYNAVTGVWTVTGTVTNVNAALANVSFVPATNNDANATIATHIEDQDGAGPADGVISLNVTPANDAPTATNLTSVTAYTEGNAGAAIADIVVTDNDAAPAQTITATLTLSDVATGTLTTTGAATYNAVTGVWTVTGTVTNVNAALANVSFVPATNNDANATIATHIEDQDGAGPADGVISLNVTPANDAPTATNLTTTSIYNVADPTVPITDIVISEVDNNPGQTITATLTLADVSTGILTTSGSATYNVATGIWTMTDTVTNVNDALANLSFQPVVTNVLDTTVSTQIQDQDGAGPPNGAINLDVTVSNSRPSTSDSTATLTEDTTYAFSSADFPFTDLDPGATLAEIRISTLESAGRLTLSGADVTFNQVIAIVDINAGNLQFSPSADSNGPAFSQFSFVVSDGMAESTTSATLTLDVTPLNDSPSGVISITGTAEQGSVLTADTSEINDADGFGTFTVQWFRDGISIDGANLPTYALTSDDVDTSISIAINFTDDNGTDEEVLSLGTDAIEGANDAPIVLGVGNLSVDEDSVDNTIDLTAGFEDPDDDELTFTLTGVSDPSIFNNLVINENGILTLSYNENTSGESDITITASDPKGETASETFTVTVNAVIDLPQGVADVLTSAEEGAITVSAPGVFANDIKGDSGDLQIQEVRSGSFIASPGQTISGSNGGSFVIGSDGTLNFNPGQEFQSLASGQIQTTSVTYTAADPDGNEVSASVSVTVVGTNDPLQADDDVWQVTAEETIDISANQGVLSNDSDPDTADTLTVLTVNNGVSSIAPGMALSGSAGGTFTLQSDGSFLFDPGVDFIGLPLGQTVSTFVNYEVSDSHGSVKMAQLQVIVVAAEIPVSDTTIANPSATTAVSKTANSVGDTGSNTPTNDGDTNTSQETQSNAPDTEQDDEASSYDESATESDTSDEQDDEGSGISEFSPQVEFNLNARTDNNELSQFQNEVSVTDQLSSTTIQAAQLDIDPVSGLNALTIQGLDARASANLIGTTDSLILISSPNYSNSLDESRAEVAEANAKVQNIKGGSLTVSAGISIGYIIYLIRSGVIMSSVLTALPAWRLIDPLPILGQFDMQDDSDEESIEEIIQSGSTAESSDPDGSSPAGSEDASFPSDSANNTESDSSPGDSESNTEDGKPRV